MITKGEILSHCRQVLTEKIQLLKAKLNELVEDAENDSKSSAGDKHETARAMMQLEQEKLITQLSESERQLDVLSTINPEHKLDSIRTGALVETGKGILFFAIPLGRITIGKTDIMVISSQAPLAKIMLNARSNQSVSFNGTEYQIKSIN